MSFLSKPEIDEITSTWAMVEQDVDGNGQAFFQQ
jgi:hypothetical protein